MLGCVAPQPEGMNDAFDKAVTILLKEHFGRGERGGWGAGAATVTIQHPCLQVICCLLGGARAALLVIFSSRLPRHADAADLVDSFDRQAGYDDLYQRKDLTWKPRAEVSDAATADSAPDQQEQGAPLPPGLLESVSAVRLTGAPDWLTCRRLAASVRPPRRSHPPPAHRDPLRCGRS